jgi:serine/tyrosine/threonine adenylyltransferase
VAVESKARVDTTFDNRFVRSCPGDALAENVTRQVRGAVYSKVTPTPVAKPELVQWVPEVAALLGLPAQASAEWVEVLGGNRLLPGMVPYAACYGGHQFGNWAGQLGDGRAITLGEVVGAGDKRWELQLKGPGPTPYSRRGDGRAVLRSSLRELVCSEAMFHLGVPTTRALSLVTTGEPVMRDMFYDGNPMLEPGAITTRVAESFIRFGHFELPTSRGDIALLESLTDYVLANMYPHLGARSPQSVVQLFTEIAQRTIRLVVEWQRVGFVHGVMNTDNMSILGLTIDYGPYGWLESFDPLWTPNTTDLPGRRYAFGRQPSVAQWNLLCLANALVPLVGETKPLEAVLDQTADWLHEAQLAMWCRKLGLPHADAGLIEDLFTLLAEVETDWTLFFRRLSEVPSAGRDDALVSPLREAFYAEPSAAVVGRWANWLRRWESLASPQETARAERLAAMNRANPLYVPRNYLAHEVIEATTAGDHGLLSTWLEVLRRPYDFQPGAERWARRRPDWAKTQAGCSQLSCSS